MRMKENNISIKTNYTTNNVKLKIERFESIGELNKYLQEQPLNKVFYGTSLSMLSSRTTNYSFTKTNSYEEAEKMLVNGWEEKSKQLIKQLSSKQIMNDKRNKMVYDAVGFQPSVPRYLQGMPQNMFNTKKVATKKSKVLNVVKMISYHFGIKADEIEEQSIKALRIVQLLENQGYKCNLFVNATSESDGIAAGLELKIKNSSDRLNISKVAFPMIHASFLRRIKFAWVERSVITPKGHIFGYGRPYAFQEEQKGFIEELRKLKEYENTLFIPNILYVSEEEFVKDALNEIK